MGRPCLAITQATILPPFNRLEQVNSNK